jgi:two-component system chemotaxis response regulator CheB
LQRSGRFGKVGSLNPDVVTLDIEMPGLNGLQTLRHIMNRCPRPVIMVSAVTEAGTEQTFDSLAAGAFDYVPKNLSSESLDIGHIRQDLITKIRAAAQSRKPSSTGLSRKPPGSAWRNSSDPASSAAPAIIALGTSTGGPKALEEILPVLPPDLSVPLLIVQHMPPGFTAPFARRMNDICAVTVREASNGEPIMPGCAYVAPAGMHMIVRRLSNFESIIHLDSHPEHCAHIPSIDVLMKSVAEAFTNSAMGVILTGMGCDGAQGMKAIHCVGGITIGQNEESCAVYSMPRACADLGILSRVVPLSEIPRQILLATRSRKRA